MVTSDLLKLNDIVSSINPNNLIHTIEEGIKLEQLHLELNQMVLDTDECRAIRNRISDAQILLSLLYLSSLDWKG